MTRPLPLESPLVVATLSNMTVLRKLKPVMNGIALPLAVLRACLQYTKILGDVYAVSPECFRSAQLRPQRMEKLIRQHGLKCVLNLRGAHPRKPWYLREKEACARAGATLVDVDLHLGLLSPPQDVQLLMETLKHGPYPLLMHCKGGADRTGMAAALYLALRKHQPLQRALKSQLALRFGHIPVGEAGSVAEFFVLYQETAAGQSIDTWAAKTYPQLYASIELARRERVRASRQRQG